MAACWAGRMGGAPVVVKAVYLVDCLAARGDLRVERWDWLDSYSAGCSASMVDSTVELLVERLAGDSAGPWVA